jgi:putative ABC transport system permease protein
MAHHFATRSQELQARRGWWAMVRFWLCSIIDLALAAAAERKDRRMMTKQKAPGGASDAGLGQDTRFAFRTLGRSPGFTLVALLTLGLGIGGTTAMYSVLDSAVFKPLPFPDANRLVMGRATFEGRVNPWASFPDYVDYRDRAGSLASLAAIAPRATLVTITGAGEPEEARLNFATANLFSTLGAPPAKGRTFTVDETPSEGSGQVVISDEFRRRWFGEDGEVVGRTLIVSGGSLTVMGVLPPGFRFLADTDLWVPPWPGNSDPITRRYHNWLLVGRLAEGASLQEARAEVDVISAQLREAYPESNRTKALQVDRLQDAMLEGYSQSLLLLTGAIALVLLIACSNVAGLLMARGTSRSAEMAIRASMGAGRLRLIRQLLVECTVLALGAGALGMILAVWLQDLILGLIPMDRLDIGSAGLSSTTLGTALVLSLLTVLLFGALPSLATARANPAEDLKEGSRGSGGRGGVRLRSALVAFQVAVSLVLLVGSGLLMRSFARLRAIDPGFRVENLFTATLSPPAERYGDGQALQQFYEALREEVEALPGVQSVALVNQLPILHPAGNVAIWAPERPPETNPDATWADRRVIFPGYFETMEIPFLGGRAFEESDDSGSPAVIILSRRTADRIFPEEDALGRQVAVDMGGEEPGLFQVVGLVEDHRTSSVESDIRPVMFFSYRQLPQRTMRLAVASASPAEALFRPIQERVWALDSDLILSAPGTMEDAVSGSIGGARALAAVLVVFAAVAVGLAALGLYGVLAFLVTRQAREMGIRMALGASGGRVLLLVLSRGIVLVALGSALGVAGALGAAGFVEGFLYQTSARDPVTYAAVTAFFLLVTLGACLPPAWRAANGHPAAALRAD